MTRGAGVKMVDPPPPQAQGQPSTHPPLPPCQPGCRCGFSRALGGAAKGMPLKMSTERPPMPKRPSFLLTPSTKPPSVCTTPSWGEGRLRAQAGGDRGGGATPAGSRGSDSLQVGPLVRPACSCGFLWKPRPSPLAGPEGRGPVGAPGSPLPLEGPGHWQAGGCHPFLGARLGVKIDRCPHSWSNAMAVMGKLGAAQGPAPL